MMVRSNGSVIGTVPACTRKDAQKAIDAAIEGQKALAKLSLVKRIELLHKATELAKKRDEESSRLTCLESGKPIQQAVWEGSTILTQFSKGTSGFQRRIS